MKMLSRLFSCQAIKVSNGDARIVKGGQNWRLANEIGSFCKQAKINHGEIWIKGNGRSSFSGEIPKKYHQKLRNIISVNGH